MKSKTPLFTGTFLTGVALAGTVFFGLSTAIVAHAGETIQPDQVCTGSMVSGAYKDGDSEGSQSDQQSALDTDIQELLEDGPPGLWITQPPTDFYSNPQNYCISGTAHHTGNPAPDSYNINLHVYSGTGRTTSFPSGVDVNAAGIITANPTASISASPTSEASGGQATITWSSTNATSCTGSGGTFTTGGATSGSTYVYPTTTTTYSVYCSSGGENSSTQQVTVNIIPPPTATLSASPATITTYGGSSTLTWSSSGSVTACYASGGTFNTYGAGSGSQSVSPTVTTTYTVQCTGPGGNGNVAQVTVVVNIPNPTASISVSPPTINEFNSATVSWNSANATSCTGSGGAFNTGGATSGSQMVNPTTTTTYSVYCSSGSTNSSVQYATLTVIAAPPNLTASNGSDVSVVAGSPITISGTVTNSGTGPASPTFPNAFHICDYGCINVNTYVAANSIASLAAGSSQGISASYTPTSVPSTGVTPGKLYFEACANTSVTGVTPGANPPSESNTTDNCAGSGTVWNTINVMPQAATGLTATCNTAGTNVTLSWTAAQGATSYYPRMAQTGTYNTPAECTSAGWSMYDSSTCYPDVANPGGLPGTSVANFPITTGQTYGWWVHSADAGGINPTPAYGTSFSCLGQPDLGFAASVPDVSIPAGSPTTFTTNVSNFSGTAPTTGGGFYNNFEVCDPTAATNKGTAYGNCSITTGTEVLDGNADSSTVPPYSYNGTTNTSNGVWYAANLAPGATSGAVSFSWTPPSVQTWTLEQDLNKDIAEGGLKGDIAYVKDYVKSIFYPDAFAGSAGSYSVKYRWCTNFNSAWTQIVPESNLANNCTNWGTATVNTPIPTVSCSANPTTAGAPANITWTATPSGGSAPYTYVWGGNVSGSSQSVVQNYPSAGTYSGTVQVTDKTGATSNVTSCTGSVNVISCVPSLSASPATPPGIILGQTDNLTWNEPGICASSCTFSDGHTGGISGTYTVTPPDPTPATTDNYSVTCGSPANVNTTSIHVIVPTVSITATPDRVVSGQTSTIAWTSADTTSCTVTGNGNSWTGLTGSKTSNPITEQTTYNVTCSSAGSPVHSKVILNIVPKYTEF